MEASIVAALITAWAAIVGLYAGHRLKVKEFRVIQIKSRIDTLEQAVVSDGGGENSKEEVAEEGPEIVKAIGVALNAAWYRFKTTEQQYSKYKWLLDPNNHKSIEKLLYECNELSRKLAIAKATNDVALANELIPPFIGKTQELQKTYEKARLSTIERLYLRLKKEVGV